jgi:hypothetical protein
MAPSDRFRSPSDLRPNASGSSLMDADRSPSKDEIRTPIPRDGGSSRIEGLDDRQALVRRQLFESLSATGRPANLEFVDDFVRAEAEMKNL